MKRITIPITISYFYCGIVATNGEFLETRNSSNPDVKNVTN